MILDPCVSKISNNRLTFYCNGPFVLKSVTFVTKSLGKVV